jgi:hypothetical protein
VGTNRNDLRESSSNNIPWYKYKTIFGLFDDADRTAAAGVAVRTAVSSGGA